jgi:hypothetical protein
MAVDGSRPYRADVVATFAVLTLALTYPLSFRAADTVISPDPDGFLFLWTLAWDTHAFVNQPGAVFDSNIYYPYARTLAYSENLIGSAFFAAPVIWATGNVVLALNVVTLLTIALCGIGAYWLGRTLGMSRSAAYVTGIIFAFSPARFFRLSQMHLTAVQWIPFSLAALHRYFDRGQPRDLKLAIAFFSLQALSTGHGAVFLLVAIAVVVGWRFACGEPIDFMRRVRDVGVSGLLLLAPSGLVLLPYRQVNTEMGLTRSLANWTATPQSYLASPTHLQSWLLSFVPNWQVNELASAFLFPGWLPLILAVCAWTGFSMRGPSQTRDVGADETRWQTVRTNPVPIYSILAILSVLLTVGPPFGLWPYVYWLPGMSFIRVPSRFIILAVLALSVLAGFGFDSLSRALGRANRLRASLAPAIVVLLLAEFVSVPLRVTPFQVRPPAADRWLDMQPKPFVVAEVPVQFSERYQTTYMLHSTAHWQRTIHGFSGIRPPLHEKLFRDLWEFPSDESLEGLADLNVTYVVVHLTDYPPEERPAVEERLTRYSSWLTLQYQDKSSRVYTLKRP